MSNVKKELEALFRERPVLRELFQLNWVEEGLADTEEDLADALDSLSTMDAEDYAELVDDQD
jgi:hypothetical protein